MPQFMGSIRICHRGPIKKCLKLRESKWKIAAPAQKRRHFSSLFTVFFLWKLKKLPATGNWRSPQATHKRKAIPTVFSCPPPQDANGDVKRATTKSPAMAGLLESKTRQNTNTPARLIIPLGRKRRAGEQPATMAL